MIVGWLRWGMFWDQIPFMNMLTICVTHRNRGLGTELILDWERSRAAEGHPSVMTSTLSSEPSQKLYRRLGYRDCGALLLPEEPLEILFVKSLGKGSVAG